MFKTANLCSKSRLQHEYKNWVKRPYNHLRHDETFPSHARCTSRNDLYVLIQNRCQYSNGSLTQVLGQKWEFSQYQHYFSIPTLRPLTPFHHANLKKRPEGGTRVDPGIGSSVN